MTFSSVNLVDRIFKVTLGTIIFIVGGINSKASAFSLTPTNNSNNYDLEELSYFSLKLNRNTNNQIAIIGLQQGFDFGKKNTSIIDRENQDQNSSTATINIEFQSQETQEQKILEYLVGSLKKLELQTFSDTSLVQPSAPVLPQVSYGNIYQDVYNFSVSLVDTESTQPKNTKNIRESNSTNSYIQPRKAEEFTSYFQASEQPNYISRRNTSTTNNIPAPLPTSLQGNSSPDNLLNQQLTDSLPAYNQLQSSFLPQTVVSPSNSSHLGSDNENFHLLLQHRFTAVPEMIGIPQSNNNELATIYLPFDNLESYQSNNFNLPSKLNRYQKSEHQKNLEEKIEKKQEQVEKQRERMYQKIEQLRIKRERLREEKAQKYRQLHERRLSQTRNRQKQIQQRIQQQIE